MTNSKNELLFKLDGFIRKYYKNQLIKGGLYTIGLLLVFYLFVVVLEYYIQFGVAIRTGLFYFYLIISSTVLVRYILMPLLKLWKFGDVISYSDASVIIGKHFPVVKDKLLNTLQLQESINTVSDQKSGLETEEVLTIASIEQKTNELRSVAFSSAVDFGKNKKHLKVALLPIFLFLFLLLTAPSILTEGSLRIVKHTVPYIPESLFQFVIKQKLEVVQSDDFALSVGFNGKEMPGSVYLEQSNSRNSLKAIGKEGFEYLFKNVQKDVEFELWANGVRSKKYLLKVLPNPVLINFETEITYPDYLNKKQQLLKSVGDLILPEGSKIEWILNTANTEKVYMGFVSANDNARISLVSVGKHRFSHSKTVKENLSYSIITANAQVKGRDSLSFWINVIPDLYPVIQVDEFSDSTELNRRFFTGLAEDDHGLTRLTFNYRIISEEIDRSFVVKEISLVKEFSKHQFFFDWSLDSLELLSGETVEYYFETWDNDGVNGVKSSKSDIKKYNPPSIGEISKMGDKNNNKLEKKMEEALELAKRLKKELSDAQKKAIDKKTISWEDKQNMRQLLENQRTLQKEVEKIKSQTTENFKQQTQFKEIDQRLKEKQKALEELIDKIMTDEMKEFYSEMDDLMEKMDKQKLQELMEQMEMEAEDIEKELDRSLEIFKQLALEQKLQDIIDQLDQLKEKQQQLSEKTDNKNSKSDEIKQKQDQLNDEFEKAQENLEQLNEMNKELENPNDLSDTKEKEAEIKNQMQNSSKQLEGGKKKKASESQKNAAEKLDELSGKLLDMQAEMSEEGQTEDMEALRQLLENLVKLSFDQEEIMTSLKSVSPKSPLLLSLTQGQRKLKDDAKMVEDSLFALSKRIVQIEPLVNREINLINNNLKKTILLMQDRQLSKAASRQQYVMTSTNNLALLLSEILEQMQDQAAQQKAGQKSCPKPGCKKSNCQKPGHGKPSVSSMKGMQKKLNEQMRQMKEGLKSGKKGMSKGLAKMAAQQEAIRNELGRINQEINKDGKGSLGNLEKLSKLMEETEEDLVNRRISQETINRQNEILTRLLKAENAEREREKDEKRESIEGKNKEISNPKLFFEYNRAKQKEAELLKTVPASLNPFFKQKVDEYFNNFKINK